MRTGNMAKQSIIVTQVRGCAPDYHSLAVGLLELVRESMRDPAFMAEYRQFQKEEEKCSGSSTTKALAH